MEYMIWVDFEQLEIQKIELETCELRTRSCLSHSRQGLVLAINAKGYAGFLHNIHLYVPSSA